jgi:hypothetical protein
MSIMLQMVALDRQRNATREALTALRKRHEAAKAWVQQSSNSFERCSKEAAIARLQAGEYSTAAVCAISQKGRGVPALQWLFLIPCFSWNPSSQHQQLAVV